MPAINRSQAVKGAVLVVRDVIANNITDPATGTRGTTGKFVMTSWPEREARMPLITVEQQGWQLGYLGTSTTETLARVGLEINVWTQSEGQKDSLAGSVIAVLEQQRTLLVASGLHDFRMTNATNLNEEGKGGTHRKVMEATFLYPSTT